MPNIENSQTKIKFNLSRNSVNKPNEHALLGLLVLTAIKLNKTEFNVHFSDISHAVGSQTNNIKILRGFQDKNLIDFCKHSDECKYSFHIKLLFASIEN